MSFVQAASIASSATVNVLITPAITTTTGNAVVLNAAVDYNAAQNATPSDSNNNVWTAHPNNKVATGNTSTSVMGFSWYAKNITGGSGNTFTVTTTLTSASSLVVLEFFGRALDFPAAATSGVADTSATTAHNSGTITTPLTGCDLVSFHFTASTVSEVFNTGQIWFIPANATNPNGASYNPSFAQISNNVAQGSFADTWNTGDSTIGAGLCWALKPPSYTVIQSYQNSTSTGATSVSFTTGSPTGQGFTTGNTLLYVVKYSASAVQSALISDTLNNSWQQINSFFDGANNTGIAFGFAKNIVGGQDTVTFSLGGASFNFLGLYVVEVAGLSQTSPYTTGEFVVTKVVSPGNGANGVASQFTGNISKHPSMLFGFVIDATNSSGQVLSPGTNFNSLGGVWTFGLTQNSSLPEHTRI
jgi:hypothetical protein